MGLRLHNTLTRAKEDFVPLEPGKVRMYVCGITAYAPSHIGHARAAVAFDVLYRWLRRSYAVTYVRNFTDIDDKIIQAAAKTNEPATEVAERYMAQYGEDVAALRCLPPSVEPRVTDHLPEIVELIRRIEAAGVAYPVDGDVYFEVGRFPAYGRLSGRSLEQLEAGARVEVDERKRSPHDFALWKSAKVGEPSWPSPWGAGRPGWHIECSAMAEKYLGPVFDIHGGGKDLVFPHHENEIAQSCVGNQTSEFARYWLHNGFVNLLPEVCPKCGRDLGGETAIEPGKLCVCSYAFTEEDLKMSKSRGNFYPVREILARYEGEALRLFFLTTHYRKPLQFSHAILADAERRLDKLYETLHAIDCYAEQQTLTPGESLRAVFDIDPSARFAEAMDDDLNTAKAIAELGELARIANELLHNKEKERIGRALKAPERSRLLQEIRAQILDFGDALGLFGEQASDYLARRRLARAKARGIVSEAVEARIQERLEARRAKNFQRADEIRDELRAKGVLLKDGKDTTSWDVEES